MSADSDNIKAGLPPEISALPNANLTDDQLIMKTRDLPEVRFLISKYPYASESASVMREHQIAADETVILVTYSVEKNFINSSGSSEWRKMKLVVSLVPDTNATSHIGVGCELSGPSILPTFSENAMDNLRREICFQ